MSSLPRILISSSVRTVLGILKHFALTCHLTRFCLVCAVCVSPNVLELSQICSGAQSFWVGFWALMLYWFHGGVSLQLSNLKHATDDSWDNISRKRQVEGAVFISLHMQRFLSFSSRPIFKRKNYFAQLSGLFSWPTAELTKLSILPALLTFLLHAHTCTHRHKP